MASRHNKEAQTEEISRNNCDSCGFAVLTIKNLYKQIAPSIKEFNVTNNVPGDIYEITQAGYMNKITGIIEETVKTLLKEFDTIKRECAKFKTELENTEMSLANSKAEVNKLLNLKEQLDAELQKVRNEYEDVVQIKNNFYHKMLQKQQLIGELQEEISRVNKKYEALQNEQKKIKEANEKLEENKFLLISERDFLKRRFEDATNEEQQVKLKCEHLKIKVSNTEKELESCGLVLQEFDRKIAKNSQNFEGTIKTCDELQNRINVCDIQVQCVTIKFKLQEIQGAIANGRDFTLSEMLIDNNARLSVDGDPVKDMKKEIDHNNAIIERLSGRNTKLLNVISRLYSMHNSRREHNK